jgi:hypothetical protein
MEWCDKAVIREGDAPLEEALRPQILWRERVRREEEGASRGGSWMEWKEQGSPWALVGRKEQEGTEVGKGRGQMGSQNVWEAPVGRGTHQS